jgi:tyrosinase
MSGNGQLIANHAGAMGGFIPAGLGGGCVETGPFKNMTVNLGPIGMQPVGPSNGLGYNPRCLKRDVGPTVATQNTNYTSVMGKWDRYLVSRMGKLTHAKLL